MNKYTELSDFEVNKRVFVTAKIEHEDTDLHSNKVFYGDGANWIEFNPCNNPVDAMPIIIKNGIATVPFIISKPVAYDSSKGLMLGATVENDNVLRAAMEVLLMMEDEK